MKDSRNLGEVLRKQGVSRRSFLKFCAAMASTMALPPSMIPAIAASLEQARRPSVIWLSFQECTGCTESITRSSSATIEDLIFNAISLDYHHTLQAASGHAAEQAREAAMETNYGNYLLVVDGSIPVANPAYSTIAGISNLDMLRDTAAGAAAIVAVGSCAAFGGIPKAHPNPTGAVAVSDLVSDKPIINVPGCPPIPSVLTGVLVQVPDLRPAGTRRSRSAAGVFRPEYPRPLLPAARFTTRACLPKPSTTRAHARAGACTSSAARDRRLTTPAPPPSGTTAPVFRSRPAIPVSAVPSPTSGTAAVSTRRCRRPPGRSVPRLRLRSAADWSPARRSVPCSGRASPKPSVCSSARPSMTSTRRPS